MIRRAFKRIPYQTRRAIVLGSCIALSVALQGCAGPQAILTKTACLPMVDYTGVTVLRDAAGEIDKAQAAGVPMDNQKTLDRDYHVLRNLNKLACQAGNQTKEK